MYLSGAKWQTDKCIWSALNLWFNQFTVDVYDLLRVWEKLFTLSPFDWSICTLQVMKVSVLITMSSFHTYTCAHAHTHTQTHTTRVFFQVCTPAVENALWLNSLWTYQRALASAADQSIQSERLRFCGYVALMTSTRFNTQTSLL